MLRIYKVHTWVSQRASLFICLVFIAFLLSGITLSPSTALAQERVTATTTGSLNARAEASTSAPLVGTLAPNRTVTVLAQLTNEAGELWLRIPYECTEAWIAGWLVNIAGDLDTVPVWSASADEETGDEAVNPALDSAADPAYQGPSATPDWIRVARCNPDDLPELPLAPELQHALQDPNYLQLGYLDETGVFVGIPLVFNPCSDAERREFIAAKDDIHGYYVVQTPRTREVLLDAIIPAIQDLFENHNSIPDAWSVPPQIIVTHGEIEDRSGFLPTYSRNGFGVYRNYNPDTNVLHINVRTANEFGMWGADVMSFLAAGIELGFSSDNVDLPINHDWWTLVNPMTSRPDAGYGIVTTDSELLMSTQYSFEFPVDLAFYGLDAENEDQ